MSIEIDHITIPGSTNIRRNLLPQFRSSAQNLTLDPSYLLNEEKTGYGYQCGSRFLPYLLQDRYDRDRKSVSMNTIVMENAYQKAVFLPEYGMRLYSLVDKQLDKELLYCNPVFQPANLAILRAWFSGGIEWNIGQYGHTFFTCDDLHAGICTDEHGEEFLRCYEYERCKGLYFSIDFYLRENDRFLTAYTRIINPNPAPVPLYWWTNIAVREEKNARVISGTNEVIYKTPDSTQITMKHGKLPFLPTAPDQDSSYPMSFRYSNEFFFQNKNIPDETWEAALYDDGFLFFERSTPPLRYRKMFCWGMHQGGKKWKDYLSEKGQGNYFEIQAGLCPTQLHGTDLDALSSLDFVQSFGGKMISPKTHSMDFEDAKNAIYQEIRQVLPTSEINSMLATGRKNATNQVLKLLHTGHGFGRLEEIKTPEKTPAGFLFTDDSVTAKEQLWYDLLTKQEVTDLPVAKLPDSYMVDISWEPLLLSAAKKGSYTAYNLLGVLYQENFNIKAAREAFLSALSIKTNPFSYRCLALAEKDESPEQAFKDYSEAIKLLKEDPLREYAEEYVALLIDAKRYQDAWDYYNTLPIALQEDEGICLLILRAAIHLKNLDFLEKLYQHEFAIIREGSNDYTDGYFSYQALREAKEKEISFSEKLVEKYRLENKVPEAFDFRQI